MGTERPRPLAPGESFVVSFADNTRTCEVVALSNAKQKFIAGMLRTIMENEKQADPIEMLKTFDMTEEIITVVCPNATDEFLDSISGQNILEIAGACMSQQEVDPEELGKSD